VGIIAALGSLDVVTEHCVHRGIDGHKQFAATPDWPAQVRDDGLQGQGVSLGQLLEPAAESGLMRNAVPTKHGRYGRLLQNGRVADGFTAEDSKGDELLQDRAARMSAALIQMRRYGIQSVGNAIGIETACDNRHPGSGCHRFACEGKMRIPLFENFTAASNPAIFHLHPFGDLFFADGLRLTLQDHFKRVLFLGQE
jgi:hypothetical protein